MSRAENKITNGLYRIGYVGGTALFASSILGSFIEPILPIAVTILGSLIIGFIIRGIFVRKLNKKLFSEYRYSNANNNKQSTHSSKNNSHNERTNNEKINHKNTDAPSDSLTLYRNLLGLEPHFTSDELKTAYHHSAAKYHPDHYASASPSERQNAEDLMKKVNEAYECLKHAAV